MSYRRSFLKRLSSTLAMQDHDHIDVDEAPDDDLEVTPPERSEIPAQNADDVGELAVDVFEDRENIIIKAVTAGVRKSDLDISLTRESVTINGERANTSHATDDQYFFRELYWGKFTRTIELPYEIDVDESEAKQEDGLLFLRLPKLDKNRETKLKIQ